jgi:hypothetical protein
MSGNHVINLSTAWEPPEPATGQTVWTRRFGMPAGIEPGDHVFLVIEAAASCGATLAGTPLPSVFAGLPWRQDVTERLGPRNELVLIPAAALVPESFVRSAHGRRPLPAAIGSVRLEIEPGAGGRG